MTNRRITLRRRLMSLAMGLVALSAVVSSLLFYRSAKRSLEEHLGDELLAVANSVAPLIDGDVLPFINARLDGGFTGREEFDEIREVLDKVAVANGLISKGSPIYILRRAPEIQREEMEFVVMTFPDESGRWYVGNRCAMQSHHRRALDGLGATSGVYEDGDGLWISASAPVRNTAGEVVAIVQADRPVNFFYLKARGEAAAIAVAASLSLLVAAILAAMLAKSLTKPVQHLVAATERLAGGELNHLVDLRRNDELGDLGESINNMARQLDEARQGLLLRQSQISRALEEARTASEAKGAFLANMSHELRTPLNAIIGYSEMLQEIAEEEGWKGAGPDLARICAAAKHLLELINTVLDFSKIEAGKLTVDMRPYPIDQIVDEVVSTAAPLARRGSNQLTVRNHLGGEMLVLDPLRFRQSLLNLMSNACKFTENGEVALEVSRRMEEDNCWVLWRVSDTGPGIQPEDQDRLFQPFSQVDTSPTRRHQGTGLGLALSAELCQLMSGHITVESEPGKGSVFTIWMPGQDPSGPSGTDIVDRDPSEPAAH